MNRILIVEDDELVSGMLRQMLAGEGYTVTCADNGRHAIRQIEVEAPGLIITDILMPEMDGVELISCLRRRWPDSKIIAISGGGSFVNADECIEWAKNMGVDRAFTKPFQGDELLASVKNLLR